MRLSRTLLILGLCAIVLVFPHTGIQGAPAAAPRDSAFGINSHIASRYPDPSTVDQPAELVAQLGVGWAREDFQFSRIQEQQDEFFWEFHDNTVDALTSRGISILGVLNGPTPVWAILGNPTNVADFYPPDPQLFAAFAGAVVDRYKDRIQYWQVWNEPDNTLYWKPERNDAAYANLLKVTYSAIKTADPNARVLVAGTVSPEPAVSFLQAIYDNGAWNAFDILAIHPYTDPKGPEEGDIASAGVGAVRVLADRLGSKPIWATEFGWSTGISGRGGVTFDESTQANYLVRGSVLLREAGVERVMMYNLRDDTHQMYGLIRRTGSGTDFSQQKASYLAYKTLNQQLAGATPAGMIDLAQRNVLWDLETFGSWQRGVQANGTFTHSSAQAHGGRYSGQLSYNFPTAGNDYVVFTAGAPLPISAGASQVGMWVYGDGSGHALKVWLRDAEGETLQFRLGFVGTPGWKFLSTAINVPVESYNRISGSGNLRLDFPASLVALVLDDEPDSFTGSGTIYLDDITELSGPEAYGVRFNKAGEVVDVLWAPQVTEITLPTNSAQGTRVELWGETKTESASGGQFRFAVGPNPIFLSHVPGQRQPQQPPQQQQPPQRVPPTGPERCFDTTSFCIAGRIRQYWEQNGGLAVFGYPISPQQIETIEGKAIQVQWFERNRLELHPENTAPYDVLIGRLSEMRLLQLDRVWQHEPREAGSQAGCLWFEQTGHNVCDQAAGLGFKTYWEQNGLQDPQLDRFGRSLALFGMPLTEARQETNASGDVVLTQWFERARFEWHPNNPDQFKVLLGLLGNEIRAEE